MVPRRLRPIKEQSFYRIFFFCEVWRNKVKEKQKTDSAGFFAIIETSVFNRTGGQKMSYNHKEIEKKWQKYWAKTNTFNTHDDPENQNFMPGYVSLSIRTRAPCRAS